MALEPHDELGMSWDDWADGRVHRLARGRDFLRSTDSVAEAAANAARRLGKVAITVEERRPGNAFLWVQFVDHQLEVGDPCPCGHSDLRRINRQIAECASCGSTVMVRERKRKNPPAAAIGDSGGERLMLSMLGGPVVAAESGVEKAARTKPRDPRRDLTRLGAFRQIALVRRGGDATYERYFGRALGPGDRPWLVVVDFALADGLWARSDEEPGGFAHAVWAMPWEVWHDVVHAEALDALDPGLVIDDPFVDDWSDSATVGDGPGTVPDHEDPPESVTDLVDVRLYSYARSSAEIERFRGLGSTGNGERVLLTAYFRLADSKRIVDPTGVPVHDFACIPLEPFASLLDLDLIESWTPDLELADPKAELTAQITSSA